MPPEAKQVVVGPYNADFPVGGVGRADGSVLLLDGGVPAIAGGGTVVRAKAALRAGSWRFVAASAKDGMVRLFVSGREVARGRIPTTRPVAVVTLASR